ncbi:hypothetical protein CDL12_05607 [Handroanthus impetiginosus]|uniref:Jacalin-type lectin domain-containing protein n=1 Tax=Handroanthus impetiginosus TaxID=429701 RepID=A0A2G9HVZ7_9LAMI|nr:hypothetical protein CDL12_05607 [Handroanthus impetiginosus]
MYTSHQYSYTHGKESYEYSMVQGSLGPNYDLIVALRQKDDHKTARPVTPYVEPKNEIAGPTPGKIERIPSKNAVTPHVVPKNEVAGVPKKIEKVPSENATGVVTYGPWGGNGGSLFDDGIYDGIRQIIVSRNVVITSIRVCYDENGQPFWGSKNGGTGSFKSDKIIFDYPSEILTHITGYHGPTMKMGPVVIKSLTFHTTKGKHGPYGEEQGQFFSTKLREGSVIVGIHGRKGLFVDAIGVHVLEGTILPSSTSPNKDSVVSSISNRQQSPSGPPIKTSNQTAPSTHKVDQSQWPFKAGKRGQSEEVAQKLVKDPAPYGPGPWGGDGGKPWDDGVFTGIKQIILTITDAVCSIEIEYDRNGQSVWSVKHGGGGGQTANRVKLDYPHEVLTCISGYYGPIKKEPGPKVIHSLTFHTTRRKYGPFGEELGTYFASGTTEGKVVGFHGRSSMYLDAIGVHMQHWLGNQKHKSSVMKMFT